MRLLNRIVALIGLFALAPTVAHALSFAYVVSGANGLLGYAVNPTTGALTPLPNSPYAAGSPISVAADPSGKFVYAADTLTGKVLGFSINANTGDLSPVPGSPFVAGTIPLFVTVDPTGKFVYVVNRGSANVSAYTINPANGTLTAVVGSPFATGGTFPDAVTVDPASKFVYVTNGTSNNVAAFTIDPLTGALTAVAGSPFATGTNPRGVVVDRTGKFAYVANGSSGNISIYSINSLTGALTPIIGSPFAAGTSPEAITIDPTGKFVYLADYTGGPNNLLAFTLDPTTGALTAIPGSPFTTGFLPKAVVVDASGKFVYVANEASSTVTTFSVDPTTGALTLVSTVSAISRPPSIALANPQTVDSFHVRYASNLTSGDSLINITNTGANGAPINGPGFGGGVGNICVNVYTFSPDEQLVSCCSCLITPNGLVSLSVNMDLLSSTLTGVKPNSVVVKLLNTGAGANFTGGDCKNSAGLAGGASFPLAGGLQAYGTTIHQTPTAGQFAVTETPFLLATLSPTERESITNRCTNIIGNGSGFGICNACRAGGLGSLR